MKSRWQCPKCGTGYEGTKHGKGGASKCISNPNSDCGGLICDCDSEGSEDHGLVMSDRCMAANCYHCGWGGELPYIENRSKWPSWAKKAYAERWTPPDDWSPGGTKP